jgi:hypothetical protein
VHAFVVVDDDQGVASSVAPWTSFHHSLPTYPVTV